MTLPRISVVTPSYNQARFLGETLASVHSQNYPNLQHIVIDGGSTDGSQEIIRSYADRLDHWVSEPDQGQTHALVKGFAHADGEVLCWLNSDDLFEPGALHQVGEFFRSNPEARAVYGDALLVDIAGQPLNLKREHPFSRFIWLYDYNYLPQPSTFWRRDLYEEVGGLDPSFDLAMDADLWIRFAEVTRLHHCPRVWSRMRLYAEQKNQRLRAASDLEDARIRSRYIRPWPHWSRRPMRVAAKALRVGWKAARGCYGRPAELAARPQP
jgi:glycosyltransferase involved in cell wall biosynthesis